MKTLQKVNNLLNFVNDHLLPSIILLFILFFVNVLLYKKWRVLQIPYNFLINYFTFMKREYVIYSMFTKKEGNIKNVKNKYLEQGALPIKNYFLNFFNKDGTVNKGNLQKIIEKQKKSMKKATKRSKHYNSLVYVGFPHVPLAFLNGKHFQDTDEVNLYEYQGKDSERLEQGFYELKRKFNTDMSIIYDLPKEECDGEVALKIEQSFSIPNEDVKNNANVQQIYSIGIKQPDRWQINNYAQVDLYQKKFVEILTQLKEKGVHTVHLFSASPVSLSFSLGRVVDHFHPEVIVYNYNNNSFDWAINLSNERLIFFDQ